MLRAGPVGSLEAAEASGAVLATLNNVYAYGPVDRPMTEDLPLAATTVKGRIRAAMTEEAFAAHEAGRVRVTEVRASDYFGPGVRDQGFLGERFVPPLLAGKRVAYPHDPDVAHSWTYVPDVVAALARVGTDERAWGRAWQVPTGPALTAREMADRICSFAGAPRPRISRVPTAVLDAAGWFVPLFRELKETRYQFQRRFVLDSSAFEATFGVEPTSFDNALAETIDWWRAQRSVQRA